MKPLREETREGDIQTNRRAHAYILDDGLRKILYFNQEGWNGLLRLTVRCEAGKKAQKGERQRRKPHFGSM